MEIPDAIRKGIESAKKNMITVPLNGTTIPHQINGVDGAGHVLLKPAGKGTGVIAGGAVRAICELAGIKRYPYQVAGFEQRPQHGKRDDGRAQGPDDR